MANAFIISSPSTASNIAVFNNVRRAYDGILAMNLSERSRRAIMGGIGDAGRPLRHGWDRVVDVPDCEEALDLRAVINWTENSPEGYPSRGGTCRQPMTQDDVKAYFRTADEGACLTFEDPQTKRQYELTYYSVR
jgi:hypothetical protein